MKMPIIRSLRLSGNQLKFNYNTLFKRKSYSDNGIHRNRVPPFCLVMDKAIEMVFGCVSQVFAITFSNDKKHI